MNAEPSSDQVGGDPARRLSGREVRATRFVIQRQLDRWSRRGRRHPGLHSEKRRHLERALEALEPFREHGCALRPPSDSGRWNVGTVHRSEFATRLRDSVLHALFSPYYFFHREAESKIVRPLFGLELALIDGCGRDRELRELLQRAAHLLGRFGRPATRRYLASVFDLRLPDGPRPESLSSGLEAYVGHDRFDLLDTDDQRRFSLMGPIPKGAAYGLRFASRPTVLVFGTYYPLTHDYIATLIADPISPEQNLAKGCGMSEIEKTLLVCNHLHARGYESLTPKAYRRDILNVFLRIRHLMAVADHIVLLLASGGGGVAIEYGVICVDDALARKSIVLVPKGDFITGLATHGTFLLEAPTTLWYGDARELLARVDERFPVVPKLTGHEA